MLAPSAELEALVESTITIPTLPTTLIEIKNLLASEDSSARDVAEVIEHDPAIAAKVLRLANSSFYGLKNHVGAIPLACSILGLRVIENIVVQAAVVKALEHVPGTPELSPKQLWDHSFRTALAARMLAECAEDSLGLQPDAAYTTGLVHDIGKLLLLEADPYRFGEAITRSVREQVPSVEAEDVVFGFSHAVAGALLAQRWQLPEALREGVLYHHSPASCPGQSAVGFLIHVADRVAHECEPETDGACPEPLDDAAVTLLGVSAERLTEIRESVRATDSGFGLANR